MLRSRWSMAMAALAALWLLPLFSAGPAMAGLEFCNKTNEKVFVAIGWRNGGSWQSDGWYTMQPDGCVEPLSGDLDNRYYYFFAESADGGTWGGGERASNFCAPSSAFENLADSGCSSSDFEQFALIDTGEADHYTLDLTDPSAPDVAVLEERCLISWDDSHQVHSTHLELDWNFQKLVTRMKKLRHCIRIRVSGPVSLEGVASEFVKQCATYALEHERTRHILEGIAALGVDVLSEGATGGGATAAKLADYINSLRVNFTNCITDTDKATERIAKILADELDAVVDKESHWEYWDL